MYNYRGSLECYFVEYFGNFKDMIKKINYGFLYEELSIYYVVLIEKGRLQDFMKDFPDLISIEQNYIYQLSKIERSNYELQDRNSNFKSEYWGKGVTIGVIGDGIDYLDREFRKEDGSTRIKAIWDQTVEGDKKEDISSYGEVYDKEDINEALKLLMTRKIPYKKVKHWSEGHGTALCKVMGGNKYGLVNQCDFAIVKLHKADTGTKIMNCISSKNQNLYETYDIVKALQYLYDLNKLSKNPMVVYLPLESNSGGRNGTSVLERYIDYFSNRSNNFFIITSSGSQGEGYTHSGGRVEEDRELYIPIIVGSEKNNCNHKDKYDFQISLWTTIYDRVDFKIISPSKEETFDLECGTSSQIMKFSFNDADIEIIFTKSRLKSKEKEVIIKMRNAVQGKWTISFKGNSVLYGDYDIWLPMKELTNCSVIFQETNLYRTITTPSTASRVLTSICYSQHEMGIRALAGKPCDDVKKRTGEVFVIDNGKILIEDDYGKLKIGGAAISGCVLCCMVATILQWAIVEGKKEYIDFNEIKLLLLKSSTIESSSDYNIINIKKFNELLLEL